MTRLAGPSTFTTMRRLMPMPFLKFVPFLTEMTQRYGNAFAFSVPWRSYAFYNDPATIKDILVTQQHAFVKSFGTRKLAHLLGEGLLTSEDPLHRTMRRIVQPAFHRERIEGYARAMETAAQAFVDAIVPGEPFDLHAAMAALTLRIATLTLFGTDRSDATAEVSGALRLMMREYPHVLLPFGELRRRLPLPASRRFDEAKRGLDAVIAAIVAQRRKTGGGFDALSMLLEARDPQTGEGLSDEQLRDEVMTLFVAGHETTANLLVWTWYLLAQHPDVDARTGAAAAAGDAGYLERVIAESMRLYPPAWVIGREATQPVTLVDGTRILPGVTVLIAPLFLHRRPDLFADPMRFDPDRWLHGDPPPFAYLPFGAGARRCIGNEFALREAAIVLRTVAARYRFALEPGAAVGIAPLVTLRPNGPVPMRAVARVTTPADNRAPHEVPPTDPTAASSSIARATSSSTR